jgi:hypothetical protein
MLLAGAQLLTGYLAFERSDYLEPIEQTWRHIPAVEVPTKLLVSGQKAAGEVLSGSPAQPLSATESATAFAERVTAPRPLVFPDEQAPEVPEKFLVLQDWEGAVESIGPETFTARLRDWTNKEAYASEIAELPIADVSDDDRELLRPGAIFYLTVGRVIRHNGRHDRVGRLVFRRLPAWTASTFRRAEQRTERLRRFLAPQT